MNRRWFRFLGLLPVLVALVFAGSFHRMPGGVRAASAQTKLLVDGDFEADATVKQLRDREKGQGWYESRQDGKIGPKLLKLSKKPVAGNATKKAMIKGSDKLNTYLTQAFSQVQKGKFSAQWDILVKQIHPNSNRSAFQMIGNASGGKGPNSTGAQRFVFLAFLKGAHPGKVDLVAYEGGSPETASKPTPVAANLDLKKWYTVKVDVDVPGKTYTVTVLDKAANNPLAPVALKAFNTGKGVPSELTHISFASWNDGAGSFLVDNVGP
jgi:hypothetical protein